MKAFLRKWSLNLCKLSGEDVAIIIRCDNKIRIKFMQIGAFVLLILICCLLSAMYFVDNMFHNTILDITIGIIWASIVTNMYVLLLYTITPTLLPVRDRKKRKQKKVTYQKFNFSFSMILRIFMMVLLATITAQPLSVLVLGNDNMLFVENIKFLLENNPWSLIITLGVNLIFVIPIYLKFKIRNLEEFYEEKARINKRLIADSYKDFNKKYTAVLESKIEEYNHHIGKRLLPYLEQLKSLTGKPYFNLVSDIKSELSYTAIKKHEYWSDPPYRTQIAPEKSDTGNEEDFLKFIYPE